MRFQVLRHLYIQGSCTGYLSEMLIWGPTQTVDIEALRRQIRDMGGASTTSTQEQVARRVWRYEASLNAWETAEDAVRCKLLRVARLTLVKGRGIQGSMLSEC